MYLFCTQNFAQSKTLYKNQQTYQLNRQRDTIRLSTNQEKGCYINKKV